jgi:hypothetical protein
MATRLMRLQGGRVTAIGTVNEVLHGGESMSCDGALSRRHRNSQNPSKKLEGRDSIEAAQRRDAAGRFNIE